MENDPRVHWQNIIIYCILAFSLFWIPFFGLTLAIREGYDPNVWNIIFTILGPFSPLIAAIIVRTIIAREGFRDAHLGILRVPWYFWLLSVLL